MSHVRKSVYPEARSRGSVGSVYEHEPSIEAEYVLTCIECERRSSRDAVGWRGYLTIDHEVVILCPVCAAKEFDGD
jgi:hypothetical protein